ncbi:MAG: response regulator [Lachnospiraceae bacterium]|nr:response regulator [Lachnospiraceae bacterium]
MDELTSFQLTKETMPVIKLMAEKIPGGFFVYQEDENRELIFVNNKVLDIYDCKNLEEFKELTGNSFEGMVHPEDFKAIQSSIDKQIKASSGENLDYVTYRIISKTGKVKWIEDYGHFSTSEDYGDVFYVFVSDITEKIEIEQRANEAKSKFLFNISHDIRTPLNAIMGFGELARKHKDEPDKVDDYLNRANDSSIHLLSLIDDLLEVNKIDIGDIELKKVKCNLKREITTAYSVVSLEADSKRQKVTIDVPDDECYLDDLRFRRVMTNIIGNAIKFTKEAGEITIRANKLSEDDNSALYTFEVIDNGIGMSKDFLDKVYDAFERELSSTESGHLGTGLGLTIVKRFVDIMNGEIKIMSEKDKGTKVIVTIPVELSAEDITDNIHDMRRVKRFKHNDPARILVAEDIEINRELIELVLSEEGYEVDAVSDGKLAFYAVKDHKPYYYDLIVMDIQMPVMDGYQATRAIRELDREDCKELPIFALSANSRPEDMANSIKSGMTEHISKPLDAARLIAMIEEYLN